MNVVSASGQIKHVLEIIKATMEVYTVLMPHRQNLIQPTHREGERLAVVEAGACFVSPFVELSCEDVADQLLLVYSSIRAQTNGAVMKLV